MKGTAAMVSGTIAAVVPMEVPATSWVKGMMATIRMMKGTERTALMTAARTRLRGRHSKIWCFAVVRRRTPKGMPKSVAAIMETATMRSVSPSAFTRSAIRSADIANHLNSEIPLG